MGFKQFRHEGCYSYCVYDRETREGVLIDPRADMMEEYRILVSDQKLKLLAVIDTRLQSHHLSGTHLAAQEFHCNIAMSRRSSSERKQRALQPGERIRAGALDLRVVETPGVSDDAICLVEGQRMIFTGDTMSAGTCSPVISPEDHFKSLQSTFSEFPASTLLFPGHDSGATLFSTLGVEKKKNPELSSSTFERYLNSRVTDSLRQDGSAKDRVRYNSQIRPLESNESHFGRAIPLPVAPAGAFGSHQTFASLSVPKLAAKWGKGSSKVKGLALIDVREQAEFDSGSIAGARPIPLSEIAFHLEELKGFSKIYLICQTGRRSWFAATTLDYLGLAGVTHISGGMQAWQQAGY